MCTGSESNTSEWRGCALTPERKPLPGAAERDRRNPGPSWPASLMVADVAPVSDARSDAPFGAPALATRAVLSLVKATAGTRGIPGPASISVADVAPRRRESVPFEGQPLCLGVRPRVAIEVDVENLVTSPYQTAALAYCGFVRQRLEECEDLTSRVAQPPSASVAASHWPDFCTLASCLPPKTQSSERLSARSPSLGHAVSRQDAVVTTSAERAANKGSTQIGMRSIALARPNHHARNGRSIVRWLAGLPRGALCRLALHQRVRIKTSDPTFTREVCEYCWDEVCDIDDVD
jgi:hypothetical protein